MIGEGRAWIVACNRCDEPVILVNCNGYKSRLCRRSVPLRDALVIGRYAHRIWNVWIGMTGLFCTAWFPPNDRPSRGRLYGVHDCVLRK